MLAVVCLQELLHVQHIFGVDLWREDETSVSEPLVRMDSVCGGLIIGSEGCNGLSFSPEEEGAIREAVGMIVHERPSEQEGAVARLLDETVPLLLHLGAIGNELYVRHWESRSECIRRVDSLR